jgi:hypothetical protein
MIIRFGMYSQEARIVLLIKYGILLLEIGCWRTLPSLDSSKKQFHTVKDPKVLQDFLIHSATQRLAHSAGTRYSEAVKACLTAPKSSDFEDWQFQRIIREKIWNPLRDILSERGS